jgi:hypothetical protein
MSRTHATPMAAFVALICLMGANPAAAQVPPFFGRGATIFDPEIGVVQSGILNDVQATVSADRKYVTMTMRPQNAQLLALREFTFQVGNGAPRGFVGGAGAAAAAGGANDDATPSASSKAAPASAAARPSRRSPAKVQHVSPSVLDRPGMTLLGRARASSGVSR